MAYVSLRLWSITVSTLGPQQREERKPEKKVENLNPTEDGEASEKAHGAPNQTQLGF